MRAMISIRRAVSILVVWGTGDHLRAGLRRAHQVGPVLLTLSRGHGIHVGDLVAFAAAYSAAAFLTRYLLRGSGAPSLR